MIIMTHTHTHLYIHVYFNISKFEGRRDIESWGRDRRNNTEILPNCCPSNACSREFLTFCNAFTYYLAQQNQIEDNMNIF